MGNHLMGPLQVVYNERVLRSMEERVFDQGIYRAEDQPLRKMVFDRWPAADRPESLYREFSVGILDAYMSLRLQDP